MYAFLHAVMGDAEGCFNAAESIRQGWGEPIAVLNSAALPVGVTKTYDVSIPDRASQFLASGLHVYAYVHAGVSQKASTKNAELLSIHPHASHHVIHMLSDKLARV